jgi:hypothetical protein
MKNFSKKFIFYKTAEVGLGSNELLRRKIESMERKYDEQFKAVFEVLNKMLEEPQKPKGQFGFHSKKSSKKNF